MSISPRMMSNKVYLNGMFDDFLFSRFKNSTFERLKCDIYEKDNVYYLEMDIPGFDKKDIQIESKNGYLTIVAEKKVENDDEDKKKNYIRRERCYGKYERSFYLGDLESDNIEASFTDGILKIVVPKKEESENKKFIEIK